MIAVPTQTDHAPLSIALLISLGVAKPPSAIIGISSFFETCEIRFMFGKPGLGMSVYPFKVVATASKPSTAH